jgi:hypothetical protein
MKNNGIMFEDLAILKERREWCDLHGSPFDHVGTLGEEVVHLVI